MSRPIASLSLDLDNKWSYMKTHGDAGWEKFPSYLDVVVPRFLDVLDRLDLKITVFVVGQDAAIDSNHRALRSIATAGHEIGNHSFHHEPWLHLYSREQIETELVAAEEAIFEATGVRTSGFRGPGYSLSADVLRTLVARDYQYDCSTFPTFLGPLARAYYFLTAKLSPSQKAERKRLFGKWTEGFRPVHAYRWNVDGQPLTEIPVTTMPLLRLPMHLSYLLYLRQYSAAAAWSYFRLAMLLCKLRGAQPSLLLHPLDFLGGDDEPDLAFFPAMKMAGLEKTKFAEEVLRLFAANFDVLPMGQHAARLATSKLPIRSLPTTTPPEVALEPRAYPSRKISSKVDASTAAPMVEQLR